MGCTSVKQKQVKIYDFDQIKVFATREDNFSELKGGFHLYLSELAFSNQF